MGICCPVWAVVAEEPALKKFEKLKNTCVVETKSHLMLVSLHFEKEKSSPPINVPVGQGVCKLTA